MSSSLRPYRFGTPACFRRPRMRVSLTPDTYGFEPLPPSFSFLTGMLKMLQRPK